MDRRYFLRSLIGGVAGSAAVRTWPFRVYSFPSKIVLAKQMDDPSEALQLENARLAIPLLLYGDVPLTELAHSPLLGPKCPILLSY